MFLPSPIDHIHVVLKILHCDLGLILALHYVSHDMARKDVKMKKKRMSTYLCKYVVCKEHNLNDTPSREEP